MSNNLIFGIGQDQNQEFAFQRIYAAYRTVLELDNDAILMVRSLGGIVLEANGECVEMLGYPAVELSGMCISNFMNEVPPLFSIAGEIPVQDQGSATIQETSWRHHDGRAIPVRVTMKRLDAPGEPVFIVIAANISELEETEKALVASNERYSDLVQNSGEGLGMVDTSENFTFTNPAACEIFGFPADQLIGKNLTSFLDEPSIEEVKLQSSIRKEGQKSIYELEIIRPDGERRWIIVTATPQYDTKGTFTGTFGIFRDITQRKLAETKVRESEQRLKEIVDLTNDWIWEIDSAWKYSFVSPKIFDILGYLPEEMIGKSPFDFLIPEDVEKVKEGVRGIVHQFKPLNAIVNRAKHKNGDLVYLETSGIPVFNEQGVYQGYRGADRDITLRKLYERELIVAKEKAEESDRLKSSILANMSHELRTPLNGILGFAEILKDEIHEAEYASMVDNIYSSGKRLMSTLNSIITLSRLESGEINLSRKVTQIDASILSVLKTMDTFIADKNIQISTTGIKPVFINTDDELLKQLLQQILDNAIKFTDRGWITIETLEVTETSEGWVVVRISDTGIGIEKNNYDLIFQEFRQVSEGFGRKYQGTGIGLTISKKIIDLLGGKITIESVPGKGSAFSIWLPGGLGSDGQSAPTSNIKKDETGEKISGQVGSLPLVLLVEDNLVNKELTILFLRNACQVDYAPDAATTLEMVRVKQYQAILMDINLGFGMNGIEATLEIRQIKGYERTPIIAVTGYTMAEEMEQLYAAGCNRHIAKPFNKMTLLKVIHEVLTESE